MEPKQFLEKLKGQSIIVRLELVQTDRSIVMADGRIYAYYEEPDTVGLYRRAVEINYGCNSHGVYRNLTDKPFPESYSNWHAHIKRILSHWEPMWDRNREVVCTYTPQSGEPQVVKASNPLVLTHLARFHGLLLNPGPYPQRLSNPEEDLYEIAARRLDGLIRSQAMDWAKLV